MTKPKSVIAAAVKAAANGSPAFVFASGKEIPSDEKQLETILASAQMASFSCTACGTSMLARAGTSPFCITCGSDDGHVHAVEGEAKHTVNASSDLIDLHCSSCDHHTLLQASVVAAVSGSEKHPIHCSCCGSEMHIKAGDASQPAEDREDPEELDHKWGQTTLNTPDVVDKSTTAAATKKTAKGVEVEADANEVFDEDDISLDDLEAALIQASDEDGDEVTADLVNEVADDDLVLEPFAVEEVVDADPLEAPVMDTDVLAPDAADMDDDLSFADGDPLVDALSMDDSDVALAFVRAGSKVVAMKGTVSVAVFSKKSAGDNYRLANSEALPIAARAATQSVGLRKGLESVGFALIRVPASAEAVVSRKATELTASFNAKRSAEKKEFASIFALAAAGLNRGEFRGYENPLRAAMESELAALGVRTPRRIVSSMFATAGLQYAQSLLEISERLSKMSASARKDLSEVLQMTTTSLKASEMEEDDEDGDEEVTATAVEARLSTPALLRPKTVVSASALTSASDILSGKASLTFASV